MGSGNEEGCVDSVVLREAVGGGSSLRDRGRLEGWGHFFQMACRKGGWGDYGFFKWSAVEMYEVFVMPCALFCLSYQP